MIISEFQFQLTVQQKAIFKQYFSVTLPHIPVLAPAIDQSYSNSFKPFTIEAKLDTTLAKKIGWTLIKRLKIARETIQRNAHQLRKFQRIVMAAGDMRQLVNSKQLGFHTPAPNFLCNYQDEDYPQEFPKRFPHISNVIMPSQYIKPTTLFIRQFIRPTLHDNYSGQLALHSVVKAKNLKKWLMLFTKQVKGIDSLYQLSGITCKQSLVLFLYLDKVMDLTRLLVKKNLRTETLISDIEDIVQKNSRYQSQDKIRPPLQNFVSVDAIRSLQLYEPRDQ